MQASSQQQHQSNSQQQQPNNGTSAKSWWDDLGSKLSGVPPDPGHWGKWLTVPFIPVIGLIALGYFLYRTRKELIEIHNQQKQSAGSELAILKKKVKKLKKRMKHSEASAKPTRAIID
ncbi:hypothetical protein [Pseudoflavitalea rhizosphaerae]|uniref:hypothetical protein n=1 Tax=Pseudoflavitalea rhizosphaerae TaxID=1884793 RepID=UPI000F8C4B73|nr:hypothetical protein [Pseudoflavitalea rhizosphaerae]